MSQILMLLKIYKTKFCEPELLSYVTREINLDVSLFIVFMCRESETHTVIGLNIWLLCLIAGVKIKLAWNTFKLDLEFFGGFRFHNLRQ